MKGEKAKFRKSNNIVSRLYLTSVIDRTSASAGAPNDRFLGNDLKWLVMHPGVL